MIFPDYPGHFDADPVVPGAALLSAVQGAVGSPIVRLDRVRFLDVVRPGQDVDVRITLDDGRLRFSLWRGTVEVARGVGSVRP